MKNSKNSNKAISPLKRLGQLLKACRPRKRDLRQINELNEIQYLFI